MTESGRRSGAETEAPGASVPVSDTEQTTGDAAEGWSAPTAKATVTLLLRHGQTPLSIEKRFAGVGDIPLTAEGRAQAAAAAARLAVRGGVKAIVSSPLRRAVDTAKATADVLGLPIETDDGFQEADFGEWEGLTFGEVHKRWPGEMRQWLADPDAAPPGGESFAAVDRRVMAAQGRLVAAHPGQTVLVVSHVTPIKTLLRHALLAPAEAMYRMHLDTGCLSEIAWFPDGPAVVRSFNDTAHLA